MATGYWTEGKIVDGTNIGGGRYVEGAPPAPTPAPVSKPAPTPAPAPVVDRTPVISPYQASLDANATATASYAAERQRANDYAASIRQARIDAINTTFAPRIANEQKLGEARLSRVAALNFNKGIVGSGVDTTNMGAQVEENRKAVQALEDSKATAINEAFGYADQLARQIAEDNYKAATVSAEAKVAAEKNRLDTAMNSLNLFGKSGKTIDEIKTAAPDTYADLIKTTGMSDSQLDAYLKVNAPAGTYQWDQAQVHGSQMVVPKMVNGKATLDKIDLGFTPNKKIKATGELNGQVYIIYEDGTTSTVGGLGGSGSGWGALSNADKSDAESWLRRQPNFTEEDSQKLHDDRTFQAYVMGKVQEEKSTFANPFK